MFVGYKFVQSLINSMSKRQSMNKVYRKHHQSKKITPKAIYSYKKSFGIARCNLELLLQEHNFTCFNIALYNNHFE